LCNLEWNEYTGGDDFRWYVLYRSNHPGIEQNPSYQKDSVFITDDRGMVSFLDTFVLSRYYALAVVDSSGLSSFSNEVCFEPGAEFPWRFYYNFSGGTSFFYPDFAFKSDCSERMYLVYYSDYSRGRYLSCRSTYNGNYVNGISRDEIYSAAERPDGTILVCCEESQMQIPLLSVFTGDLASELQTVHLDRVVTRMIEAGAGILCSSGGKALVLDPVSLQTVDSIPYSFTSAVLAEELDRVFLCRNSHAVCLRSSDLAYMGNIPGNIEGMVYSQDGVLFCIGETEIRGYDPISLTLESSYQLPENTLCSTVLSSGEYVVYVFRDDPFRVEVFSYASGEFLGMVSEIPWYSDQHCFLCDPQDDYLWFIYWNLGNDTLYGNKIII